MPISHAKKKEKKEEGSAGGRNTTQGFDVRKKNYAAEEKK